MNRKLLAANCLLIAAKLNGKIFSLKITDRLNIIKIEHFRYHQKKK